MSMYSHILRYFVGSKAFIPNIATALPNFDPTLTKLERYRITANPVLLSKLQ